MHPNALYEAWITTRDCSEHDKLSREAARPYAHIWTLWCRWVVDKDNEGRQRASDYLQATPELVARFLRSGPSPKSTRTEADISDITRGRYRSVLRELYDHAISLELLESNPVPRPDLVEHTRENAQESQILTSREWEAVYRELPAGDQLLEVRDRAILLLLLEEALTPGEIKGLTLGQIHPDLLRPGLLILKIEGKRSAQERTLPLQEASSRALQAWLGRRHEAPGVGQLPSSLVFLSRTTSPLSDRTLFKIVADVILCASGSVHMPATRHVGPLVLRNTRIVLWLRDGMPEQEVLQRAGYKDSTSLNRLSSHFPRRAALSNRSLDATETAQAADA